MILQLCLLISKIPEKLGFDVVLYEYIEEDYEIENWKQLNPLGSMCEIKDFVDAVVYLSGFGGSKVDNLTGVQLSVDCGESITGQLFQEEE